MGVRYDSVKRSGKLLFSSFFFFVETGQIPITLSVAHRMGWIAPPKLYMCNVRGVELEGGPQGS